MPNRRLNRREFLQLAGVSAAGLALPDGWWTGIGEDLLPVDLSSLPSRVREVFTSMPRCRIDPDGYLGLSGNNRQLMRVPLARTQWNLEKCLPVHRLDTQRAGRLYCTGLATGRATIER